MNHFNLDVHTCSTELLTKLHWVLLALPNTAFFRPKLFVKGLQDLILNWLNYGVELSVSKCLIVSQQVFNSGSSPMFLFRVSLKTVSRTHTLRLLWKVLKESRIICCLHVLHNNLSIAFNIVIIIAAIHIAVTVLPVLSVFVHLNNDDVGRYSKVQCHLTQSFKRFPVFTVQGIHENIYLHDVVSLQPTTEDQISQTVTE